MRSKQLYDITKYDLLTSHDEGRLVFVHGHWSGDFTGIVKYGGSRLAIITDTDGVDREICYLQGIEFVRL